MAKNSKMMIIPMLAVVLLSTLGAAFYAIKPMVIGTEATTYPLTLSGATYNATLQPDTQFARGETVYIYTNVTYPQADTYYYTNVTSIEAYVVVSVYMPDYTSLTFITITTLDPGQSFQTYLPFLILPTYAVGTYEVTVIVLDRMPGDPGATLLAEPITLVFTVTP